MKLLCAVCFVWLSMAVPCSAQQAGCIRADNIDGAELTAPFDLSDASIFFVGEFHGEPDVPEIKLALIKYLYAHYGVTDIFMEVGVSAAWLYSQYLETGDTGYFSQPVLPYAQQEYYRTFWKRLYAYNAGIGNKLRIHGMDFERIEFIRVLRLLRPERREMPEALRPVLQFIDTVSLPAAPAAYLEDFARQNEVYERVRSGFSGHEEELKQFYGEHYRTVADIVFNVDRYLESDQRNEQMYAHISRAVREQGIDKCVIFSGQNHGNKSKAGTLANRLLLNSAKKNSFVEAEMLCRDCEEWSVKLRFRGPRAYTADTTMLERIFNSRSLPACRYVVLPAAEVPDTKARQCADYLILIDDSLK